MSAGQPQPVTPWVSVTPGYFRTLGQTLLDGRLLDDRDAEGLRGDVVVVDRSWAARFFPGERAVGQRLRSGGCTTCPLTTVVGVVSDVKYAGLDQPEAGTVYAPVAGQQSRYLLVRAADDVGPVSAALRQAIREVDPSVALSSVASADDLVSRSLRIPRSLSLLIGALALAALLLSTIGIYGVMTHHVQQHARDMSIRLALGGSPSLVGRIVIGQGMTVVVGGVLAGVALALGLTRLMSSLLFGISATDPWAFGAVAATLLLMALGACALPTVRAMRVDPAIVLRGE